MAPKARSTAVGGLQRDNGARDMHDESAELETVCMQMPRGPGSIGEGGGVRRPSLRIRRHPPPNSYSVSAHFRLTPMNASIGYRPYAKADTRGIVPKWISRPYPHHQSCLRALGYRRYGVSIHVVAEGVKKILVPYAEAPVTGMGKECCGPKADRTGNADGEHPGDPTTRMKPYVDGAPGLAERVRRPPRRTSRAPGPRTLGSGPRPVPVRARGSLWRSAPSTCERPPLPSPA